MTRREKFGTSLAVLAATFNRELVPAAIEGYWLTLQGLTDDELAVATKRGLAEARFMPSPSELLALAERGRSVEADSAQAWQAVRSAIDKHDYLVASIDFGPLVNAVVRNLGGWDTLCRAKLSDLDNPGWLRKRFDEVYAALSIAKLDSLNGEPLPGSLPENFRGAGRVTVSIGDRTPPKRIAAPAGGACGVVAALAQEKSA